MDPLLLVEVMITPEHMAQEVSMAVDIIRCMEVTVEDMVGVSGVVGVVGD
jgi:hypothetical protein